MIAAEAWSERGACALCGAGPGRTERVIGAFPLQRCPGCGFLQTGRVLPPEVLAGYYAGGYGGQRHRQGQEINAQVNLAALRRLGLLAGRPARVLDVGCGYGFLLDRLRPAAAAVAGLELSATEVDFARTRLGLEVAPSVAALPPELQDGFDLITLFEVIEHIADPPGFLAQFAARLRVGGALVIGTDNFASWPVRTMGDRFPKWIPHQHISLFEPASLERLVSGLDGMAVAARASFTPWELLARGAAHRLTGGRVSGRRFQLDGELSGENSRPFRLYALRRRLNALWFGLTMRRDLAGEMMFLVARRLA